MTLRHKCDTVQYFDFYLRKDHKKSYKHRDNESVNKKSLSYDMSRKNYEKKNSGSNFVNYETEYNLYKPFIVLNLRDILTYKSQFRLYKLFSYI